MKKKVKSYLSMLLAGTLVFGCLTGCGQQNNEPSKTEQSETKQTTQDSETQVSTETDSVEGPITTEPITISILTGRQANTTNDAEDLWFFKYLEYWLAEQGYNVTLDVQQTLEADQQISLLLGSNTLPDLIWGLTLTPSNAVVYGQEEEMLLDWAPYINEKTMPNLWRELQSDMDALAASTCPDGGVYSLPNLGERTYGASNLTYGMNDRIFVNETWMEECGVSMPTNIDEFLNMLRAFKEQIQLDGEEEVIPLLSDYYFFEKFLWICLGYYGSTNGWNEQYGTEIAIKDGEVTLPAYNKEDYKTFIEIMKTCLDEGLISQDYFTMDSTTMAGLSKTGVNGVACGWTLSNIPDYHEWVSIPPFTIGDNDELAISVDPTYSLGKMWASADVEYPEVIALIVDYIYSPEGAYLYEYGPQEGKDPLNMLDGWYVNDEDQFMTKTVADGTYENFGWYITQFIHSMDSIGKLSLGKKVANEIAGIEITETPYVVKDVITGEDITVVMKKDYTDDSEASRWRLVNTKASEPYVTAIKIPTVYMSEEDSLAVADQRLIIENYIKAESAKFITGIRPLSELDDFNKELKDLGVEDYINTYREALSAYMDSYFK